MKEKLLNNIGVLSLFSAFFFSYSSALTVGWGTTVFFLLIYSNKNVTMEKKNNYIVV